MAVAAKGILDSDKEIAGSFLLPEFLVAVVALHGGVFAIEFEQRHFVMFELLLVVGGVSCHQSRQAAQVVLKPDLCLRCEEDLEASDLQVMFELEYHVGD